MTKLLAACAIYAVGVFLTFGYTVNHTRVCEYSHADCGFAGVMWPAYWLSYPLSWVGHLAIEVTK